MKTAIYPGSFDPVTNGHIDIIERALKLFDKVLVVIGDNPQKKPTFSVKERKYMLREIFKDYDNIEIDDFSGLLVDYVKKHNSRIIIRGLRAISDFEFEFQRALLNRELDNSIETVFIMTKDDYAFLNSSIIKEIAMFGGSVKGFVPQVVEEMLRKKFQ